MNRRTLMASIVAVASVASAGYLSTDALARATDPWKMKVRWEEYHSNSDYAHKYPYVLVALFIEAGGTTYVGGAKSVHVNEWNYETQQSAVETVLDNFVQSYGKEPWFNEAWFQAVTKIRNTNGLGT